MDFRNFFISYIFKVNESISRSFTKLPESGDLKISSSRSTSGFGGTLGYCRLGLMDFRNFFIPYVFDVKDSVFRSFTLLFCSSVLENSG